MTSAVTLVSTLRALGASAVVGLPGTQTHSLFEALRAEGLRTVVPTHELAAGFVAGGIARVSGKPGVLLTIPGPGFAYAVAAIAEARLDSVPLIHVCPQPPLGPGKRFRLQETDQVGVARALYKDVVEIERPEDVPSAVRRAWRHALAGEPGPVLLHLRPGVADVEAPAAVGPPVNPPDREVSTDVSSLALLERAERVVILAGQGARGAGERLAALAERLGAVVLTTTAGRGTIPEDHPRVVVVDARSVEPVNSLLADAEAVLVLGAKLSHNGCWGFRLALPLDRTVHVDASAEILRANYDVRHAVHGDVAGFVDDLLERLPSVMHPGWDPVRIERVRHELADTGLVRGEPRIAGAPGGSAEGFFAQLRAALARDAILTTDSGMHQTLTRRHYRVLGSCGLLVPTDLQSMGFAIPTAIGAKLAAPGRQVAAIVGDGGFLMSGMELATAVRERLAIAVFVFVDGHYGLIRQGQIRGAGRAHGVDLPAIDLEAISSGLGAAYVRYEGQMSALVESAVTRDGPTVVEVSVGDSDAMRRAVWKGAARSVARPWVRRLLRR